MARKAKATSAEGSPDKKQSPPPSGPAAPDEKTVEFLVNQAFRTSDYFHFAKWVLLVSLGLVGAGSLTVFGLNMDIAGQMVKMRTQVQDVDKEIKATIEGKKKALDASIEKAQGDVSQSAADAGASLRSSAAAKLTELGKQADGEIRTSITAAQTNITALETQLSDQLRQQQSGLSQNIAAEQGRLETLSAAIADQEKKLAGLKSRVDGFEKNLGSILAIESKLASGTVTGNLQLIGTVLEHAAACVIGAAIVAVLSLLLSAIGLWTGCKAALRTTPKPT